MLPIRVVFMGSPEFAVPSLKALHDAGYPVALVVTQPDKPAGRGGRLQKPAVKLAAEELAIDVFQPGSLRDTDVHERLASANADVFVVAAYGKILPQAILDLPRRGSVNVHASLLPKWRGPSPIAAAIRAGDRETGVSIMELVRKMDAGPVISRLTLPIAPDETTATLEPKLAVAGAGELVRVLSAWFEGTLTPEPQDEARATYCHILNRQDGFLTPLQTVADAEHAVRAYNPWPGVSIEIEGERLAIWAARAVEGAGQPGALTIVQKRPALALNGGLLVLDEVQRPGGKRLSGEQYLAGRRGVLPPAANLA